MTPEENHLLQNLGFAYLRYVEEISIDVFFYGASSRHEYTYDNLINTPGVFVVLFSSSVVIFMFVSKTHSTKCPDSFEPDRRRGFSNRLIAVMFMATVLNFLLFSLYVGTEVAGFVVFIQKALVDNIEIPLVDRPQLVDDALHVTNLIEFWAADLTVSHCRLRYSVSHLHVPKPMLSDLIVIWRAWVLFPDQQWMIIIPVILWIATVGEDLISSKYLPAE